MVEAAFDTFKTENTQRKTAVKDGKLTEKEYIDWLYHQQAVIDEFMLLFTAAILDVFFVSVAKRKSQKTGV